MVVDDLKNPPSVDAEYSPVNNSFVAYGMIFSNRVPSDLLSHRLPPNAQVRRAPYIY